jgi:hypothetical protein
MACQSGQNVSESLSQKISLEWLFVPVIQVPQETEVRAHPGKNCETLSEKQRKQNWLETWLKW